MGINFSGVATVITNGGLYGSLYGEDQAILTTSEGEMVLEQ